MIYFTSLNGQNNYIDSNIIDTIGHLAAPELRIDATNVMGAMQELATSVSLTEGMGNILKYGIVTAVQFVPGLITFMGYR